MADIKFRGFVALVGGGVGALDAKDGADLADKDGAIVVTTDGYVYFYSLDIDSGLAENSPDIIAPNANPGDKRWILQSTGVPDGGNTGDLVRYNATTERWEVEVQPPTFNQIILTPAASPPSDVVGGLYFNTTTQALYVGTA